MLALLLVASGLYPSCATGAVEPTLRAAPATSLASYRRVVLADVDPELDGPLVSRLYEQAGLELFARRTDRDAKAARSGAEALLSAHVREGTSRVPASAGAQIVRVREVGVRLVDGATGAVLWATSAFASAEFPLDDLCELLLAAWTGAPRPHFAAARIAPTSSAEPSGAAPSALPGRNDGASVDSGRPPIFSRLSVEAAAAYFGAFTESVYDRDNLGRTQVTIVSGPGVSAALALGTGMAGPLGDPRGLSAIVRASAARSTDSLKYRRRHAGQYDYVGFETHAIETTALSYEVGVRDSRGFPGGWRGAAEIGAAVLTAPPIEAAADGSGDAFDRVTGAKAGTYKETRTVRIGAAAGWGAALRVSAERILSNRVSAYGRVGLLVGSFTHKFRDETYRRTVTAGGASINETGTESTEYVSRPVTPSQARPDRWSRNGFVFELGLAFSGAGIARQE